MLTSGTDLKILSEVLGHSAIATTANAYAGVLDELKTDAAERLAPSSTSPMPALIDRLVGQGC